MKAESSYRIAYALFRITLGVNMFFHGFMRIISDTSAWVEGQAVTFSDSFLPSCRSGSSSTCCLTTNLSWARC